MEYVLNGEYVDKSVTIDGVTYPRQAFANLDELIPVAETPTLENGQTFDWHDGQEIDGEWVRFTVRDKTADEKMAEIRTKRNDLLAETDWMALSDVTMTSEMATYRQELRDLPETVDVDNPVYPNKP